ncbi:DUF29 family protein [Synechococcales cyanobacterium C]|uniref:DUF29 family protein n=1 Tax=Petrachloros mirabilis ULC683 TaxID=2781853 RepID=A0A8K2A9E9_9CYAN|nr:DUF29 domain-containing protein [Petrachloros mirabilis]NCJ08125.1 DUF29 family protein [Petrachloros mirabilis ULC683]
MINLTTPDKGLYEQDLALWFANTITQLKTGDFEQIDIKHLVEEIEGLAGRDRRELQNRLKVLLAHLLKRIYVDSSYDFRGWENTIREQRDELLVLLEQSPSLKSYFSEVFDNAWQRALTDVRANYPEVIFPDKWHFDRDVETILTGEFLCNQL